MRNLAVRSQPLSPSGRLESLLIREFLSCTGTMVVAHLGLRRGVVGFRQAADIPPKSGQSCQYWSIQSRSRIHFGGCHGAVCLRSALSRSFVDAGVLILYWNPRWTLWPVGKGMLVVIVTARTSPSLRVVYDVHDCFVDRHKKDPASSNGQAWRLNKWPWNWANMYGMSSWWTNRRTA